MLTATKQIEPAAPIPALAGDLRSRPFWYLRGLVTVLGRDEDSILRLIEDGSLLWAFDVSLIPERARIRELRVLPACVDSFLQRQPCKLEWPDVLKLATPHDEELITSREIQWSLNISCSHVTALIRRECLALISAASPGKNGSARIRTQSFKDFLRKRRFY